jgi:hypothetical protein
MGVRMIRGRLKYVVAGFAVLSVAAIVLATAFADSRPGGSAPVPSAPVPGSVVAHLGDAARADFGVFSRPQAGSEDVALVSDVLRGLDTKLDPSSVRLAQSAAELQVRVGGDSQSVCLALRIPGKADVGGCSPEADAAQPGTPIIATTGFPPGEPSRPGSQHAVSVLFPDGTTGAVVTAKNGIPRALGIVNNTVAFIANDGDVLSWSGPEHLVYSSTIGG